MRSNLICISLSAVTIVFLVAAVKETIADASNLPTLQFSDLVQNERPPNFYHLAHDRAPTVCAALDQALDKSHVANLSNTSHLTLDVLLGNEYSIRWDELEKRRLMPVSRADIDLNNDGTTDTIYRTTWVQGGPYLYGLLQTNGHPDNERSISNEREKEIAGGPIADTRWGGVAENVLFFTGPRYVSGSEEQIETIHPPLPAGAILPFGVIIDIVQINGRYYVLLSSAYWHKEIPIKIFVFETRAPRDHSLVCYFESNFALRKP